MLKSTKKMLFYWNISLIYLAKEIKANQAFSKKKKTLNNQFNNAECFLKLLSWDTFFLIMKKEPSKCTRTSSKTAISLNLSNIFTICQHLTNSSSSKIKYLKLNAWAIACLAKAFNSYNGNSERLYFFGLQNNCRWWLQPWNQRMLTPWKESYDQPEVKWSRSVMFDFLQPHGL